MRFTDLFLTLGRCKAEHINLYLSKMAHDIRREPDELEKEHCIVVTK